MGKTYAPFTSFARQASARTTQAVRSCRGFCWVFDQSAAEGAWAYAFGAGLHDNVCACGTCIERQYPTDI
jgi:hypothetical protein